MTSAFFGLEVGMRALRAQQTALETTGHNIANANTPGFTRQQAILATTTPFTVPGLNAFTGVGQLGTGVQVAAIRRARDMFLDVQYRTEVATQQRAATSQGALEEVEATFNEPSDSGVNSLLSQFFGAWQDLANQPSDAGARASLLQRSASLAEAFNRAAAQLDGVRTRLNDRVAGEVSGLNDLADQVASLNRQIVQIEISGQYANDLRDQRDLLVDKLAELGPITTAEKPDGSLDVLLGGRTLVTGQTVDKLTVTATGPSGNWEVRFSSDNALANLPNGRLRGLLDARDQQVPSYRAGLDTIASGLITSVNSFHAAGYGQDGVSGRPFFAGSDAATAAGQAGNGAEALAIARLRDTMSPPPQVAYASLVSSIGAALQSARGLADNQGAVVTLLEQRRESVSGVSLDEEATSMIRFQRAYEAAARLITVSDEILSKLINETGIAGR
jgi:flagellar hook-associated protein 1 FlgK